MKINPSKKWNPLSYRHPIQRKKRKNQDPDIVIEHSRIKFLFSIKNILANTAPTKNEQESSLVAELTHLNKGYYTAIQDLFRIDNIRHEINNSFSSITIIYSKPSKKYDKSLNIIQQKFDWHNFLILEDNHSPFIIELNKKLFLKEKGINNGYV